MTSGTTLVDFQFDTRYSIDLEEVIGSNSYTDLWHESHEDVSDVFSCCLSVAEETSGLGTRYDASKFATLVLNMTNQFENFVILDFKDVELISMSFADELILSLIENLGFMGFLKKIQLKNVNRICSSIINQVISNRLGRKKQIQDTSRNI